MNNKTMLPRLSGLIITIGLLFFSNPVLARSEIPEWLQKHNEAMSNQNDAENGDYQTAVMSGKVHLLFNNQIWQIGDTFRSSDHWLGLACNQQQCELSSAHLQVKREARKGVYDSEPLVGQQLELNLVKPAADKKVIIWFESTAKTLKWMKPKIVPTYYSLMNEPKRPNSMGTYEVEIDLPGHETAVFVPMLTHLLSVNSGAYLQLRANGKRQLMMGLLGTCNGEASMNNKYLLWAGDIDEDGKPDYLLNFIDAGGYVDFYLSSEAGEEDLVGLAGRYFSTNEENQTSCKGFSSSR